MPASAVAVMKRTEARMTPKVSTDLIHALERETGESIENLRATTIDERRRMLEKRPGFVLRLFSMFPFIGRGNVMRDRVISRDDINDALDKSLR